MDSLEAGAIEMRPRWTVLLVAAALALFWAQAAWADAGLAQVAEVLGQIIQGADCSPNCQQPPKPRSVVVSELKGSAPPVLTGKQAASLFEQAGRPMSPAALRGAWKPVLAVGEEKEDGLIDYEELPGRNRLLVSNGIGDDLALAFRDSRGGELPSDQRPSFKSVVLKRSALRFRTFELISGDTSSTNKYDCRLLTQDLMLCKVDFTVLRNYQGAYGTAYYGYSKYRPSPLK